MTTNLLARLQAAWKRPIPLTTEVITVEPKSPISNTPPTSPILDHEWEDGFQPGALLIAKDKECREYWDTQIKRFKKHQINLPTFLEGWNKVRAEYDELAGADAQGTESK